MACQMNYGHVLHENLLRKVRKVYSERQERLNSLKTREDALGYVRDAREKIFKSFGPMPEKSPLNAKVVGRREYDGFAVERIIFNSREQLPVTANLFLPLNANVGKCPGVIGPCGHSQEGKAALPYQRFCQSLALHGFVALVYDPLSQGERYQYLDQREFLGCCGEHNMMGKSLNMMGEFFGMWRVWDGIRALDYLLTRPEIDPTRLGVTGNSGGGTLSTYLNTFDERFTMAAPSCFITSYLRNFENELPADSEQIPPNILEYGIEMADFIIARAPRPALILGQKNDFFDARGTFEAYQDALKVYRLLGAEDKVKVFVGPNRHGYHPANREAMYEFFCKHADIKYAGKELFNVEEIAEDQLLCVDGGQLDNLKGTRRARDFIADQAADLKATRPALNKDQLKAKASELLCIDNDPEIPSYRIMRAREVARDVKKFFCNTLLLENSDGSIRCPLKFYGDDGDGKALYHFIEKKKAHLHVPHMFADAEFAAETINFNLIDDEEFCFAVEPCGSGEMYPLAYYGENDATAHCFELYGTEFFYDSHYMMFGQSYLGAKVNDVVSAVKLLKSNGYENIRISGNGLGSMVAAFAALVCDDITAVELDNYLPSFQDIIDTPVNRWPQSYTVRGSLRYFDLDDVYNALKHKKIKLHRPCPAGKITAV